MNSTQIACFLSLGRTLNYSKTANELFMSQPAVSKNIKKLEAELKVNLVKYRHHQVSLTQNGKYFWNKMLTVESIVTETVSNMQNNDVNDIITIKIGFSDISFEKSYLPKLISNLKRKYHYDVQLVFTDPNGNKKIVNELVNKRYDFQLFQDDLFFKKKELASTALLTGGFSVLISKRNPLSNNEYLTLDQLSGQKILIWEGNESIPAISNLKYELNTNYNNLDITPIYDSSSLEIYAAANKVIGIVPSFLYNPASNDVNYVKLDISISIHYSIGYLRETTSKPYFEKVITSFKQAVNFEKQNW
ncbi:transcriptional regulator [Liquorilactobacillus sucicola DSM 21376 = JCM 15457]|nr:LysR family transcriptional regulator [Liquorilactobacillus sucicola]GAJ26841.1 transcriptional regulator [Liquorilactobacillus sucicola DSM 21376 = JCM 15457]